jgi:hypothetical protein
MSESEVQVPGAVSDASDAEAQLQTLRECLMAHELVHFTSTLEHLSTCQLNASQALELAAFNYCRAQPTSTSPPTTS